MWSEYLEMLSPDEPSGRVILSLLIIVLLSLVRHLGCSLAKRRAGDLVRYHRWRRAIHYTFWVIALFFVGRLWVPGLGSLANFFGLVIGGVVIALHDAIANLAAWLFILWRAPFKIGDRVQIGDVSGDVIDIRMFQFSMIEIANWVHADQSTGRIVHVPNSKVFREPLANYETGFEYIWHEMPVMITFESDWRKAKDILDKIAHDKAEHLSDGAEQQIREAAMKYLIFFTKLTPIVYTSVADSGVTLTLRYIVKPRNRRSSEQEIWECILADFAKHDDIQFAYPTTRFYQERTNEARDSIPAEGV